MNIVAHAGIGWLLAETGNADARFRRAVFLALFWPFSTRGFISKHAYPYFSDINTVLMFAGGILIVLLSLRFKRTPLEVVSSRLDRKFVAALTEALTQPLGRRGS